MVALENLAPSENLARLCPPENSAQIVRLPPQPLMSSPQSHIFSAALLLPGGAFNDTSGVMLLILLSKLEA